MEDKLLTPQQESFLSYYTDPKSETFSNAVQSALKAGYQETYANNITGLMPEWLLENIGDMKRLRKAEKNLNEVQDLPIINEDGKIDTQLIEKRTKVDMFIAEKLNKDKYGKSLDITTKGESINPEAVLKANQAIDNYLINDNTGNNNNGNE